MAFVIIAVILIVLIIGGLMIRRNRSKRPVSYVPDPSALCGSQVYNVGEVPRVTVATPEFGTEEIANKEFVSDVSDDLLDPRNPHHAEWVKGRPDMETDAEWVAEHPEDNPS
jgi:hypothetical protein